MVVPLLNVRVARRADDAGAPTWSRRCVGMVSG